MGVGGRTLQTAALGGSVGMHRREWQASPVTQHDNLN